MRASSDWAAYSLAVEHPGCESPAPLVRLGPVERREVPILYRRGCCQSAQCGLERSADGQVLRDDRLVIRCSIYVPETGDFLGESIEDVPGAVRAVLPARWRDLYQEALPVAHLEADGRVIDELEANVEMRFDAVTGLATWSVFEDSTEVDGFLLPNDSRHQGQMTVSFSIKARADLDPGICHLLKNCATITFDNDCTRSLTTPAWVNLLGSREPAAAAGWPNRRLAGGPRPLLERPRRGVGRAELCRLGAEPWTLSSISPVRSSRRGCRAASSSSPESAGSLRQCSPAEPESTSTGAGQRCLESLRYASPLGSNRRRAPHARCQRGE